MQSIFKNLSLYFLPLSVIFTTMFTFISAPQVNAQSSGGHGVPASTHHVTCLTPEKEKAILLELEHSRRSLVQKGILPEHPDRHATTLFDWPLAPHNGLDDNGYHGISNFVDQDTDFPGQILDYNCGARSYDLSSGYNHGGTDMYTWPFSWYKMDHDQVKVVAAADGIIVFKSDGNFDKNCGFNNNNWNAVYVEHADGSFAWYGHLKNGSLTTKEVGESVTSGEYLGIVGSSGSSTGPHLHFEIRLQGNIIDPYAGDCNSLNSESWWNSQRPYFDSDLNALMTHRAPPVFPACPQTETINEKNQFCAGELVYFAGYYRDQLKGQVVQYKVFRPNGSIFQQWTQTFEDNYSSSWWWWSWLLPFNPPTGRWTYQITYLGETFEKGFDVVGETTIEASGPTNFCEGESVLLLAPVSEYGFPYQWRKNGAAIQGATDATYEATTSGQYSVNIGIESGCSFNSNSITVTVEPALPVSFIPQGPFELCESESLDICASSGANAEFLWNNGVTDQCILINTSGEIAVTVTYANGCFTETSTTVDVHPNPIVDLGDDIQFLAGDNIRLDASGDHLSYLWSTGETTSSIVVSTMGIYSVTVTNEFGCTATDEVEVMDNTSVFNHHDETSLRLYPNPAKDEVFLFSERPIPEMIRVFDACGRLVVVNVSFESDTAFRKIGISHLPAGLYLVQAGSLNTLVMRD